MKKYLKDYLFLFSISGTIILLDQLTKYLVRTNLDYGEMWSPWVWLEPYARIWHWQNTWAAFGIFQGFNLVFSILAIVVSIAIIYFFPRIPEDDWTLRLALALELGGAVGNLIDRLRFGSVLDFVSVGSFAVFNVADACISLGVVVMLWGVWRRERQSKSTTKTGNAPVNQSATEAGDPPLSED